MKLAGPFGCDGTCTGFDAGEDVHSIEHEAVGRTYSHKLCSQVSWSMRAAKLQQLTSQHVCP